VIEPSVQNDNDLLQFCTRDEEMIKTQTSNELRVSSNYQPYTGLSSLSHTKQLRWLPFGGLQIFSFKLVDSVQARKFEPIHWFHY